MSKPPLERIGIILVLGLFAILAAVYSIVIPLGEAPDEVSHFGYIEWIAAPRPLPPDQGTAVGEAHQPPLYYVFGALSTFWIARGDLPVIANPDFALTDSQTPNLFLHTRREAFPYHDEWLAWHIVRLLSVVMGIVTVWATGRRALILFQGDSWLALGTAAFVAFLPSFTYISGMVNNDNLVVTLSSLCLFLTLRIAQQPSRRCEAVLLGLLLGLALLTKLNGLVAWAFAGIVFAYVAWRTRAWRDLVLDGALCFGIAAVLGAPYLIYNLIRYGDPFGWSLVLAVTPLRQGPLQLADWVGIAQGLVTSFWGRFGGAVQVRLSDALYLGLDVLGLVALAGWLRYVLDARQHRLARNILALLSLFILFWLFLLAAYWRWALIDLGADQARKLFPGLPLLAMVIIAGLARLVPAYRKAAMTVLGVGWLGLCLGALLYLNGLYTAPAAFAQIDASRTSADFGGTIRVLDYHLASTRVAPGATLAVQFDWQALKATREDYWFLLQLANEQDTVAHKDGVPAAGRITTDWWQPGQVLSSRHSFSIPKDLAPGVYTLSIGLHPFGRWDWLPVHGQDSLVLGTIQVTPASQ